MTGQASVVEQVAAALREAAGASPREHRECGNACMFVHQARIALAAAGLLASGPTLAEVWDA